MRPLSRVTPALPVEAVKTYSAQAPLATHWREATCLEVGCPNFEHGWMTAVDERTELGQRQAHYIRSASGRRFHERRTEAYTEFVFEPGQRCFAQHQVPLERDPLFLVRLGDWRGFQGPARIHQRPEDWVEDFAEHQQRIADRIERG